MSDMHWFVLISTVAAAVAITVGIIFPAIAMGRAITQALESLARQPEAALYEYHFLNQALYM